MRPEISLSSLFVKAAHSDSRAKTWISIDTLLPMLFNFDWWLPTSEMGQKKCILRKGTYYNQATEWHNMAGGCLPPRTTLLIETNIGSMASCSLPGSPSRALHNNQLPPWIHNTASWNSSLTFLLRSGSRPELWPWAKHLSMTIVSMNSWQCLVSLL